MQQHFLFCNLPAQSAEEAQKHRQQYEQMEKGFRYVSPPMLNTFLRPCTESYRGYVVGDVGTPVPEELRCRRG
ncbi:unnamed protein product [Boreogadus saida]